MSFSESYSEIKPSFSFSAESIVKRWKIMLPGAGCQYYKKTGGCLMCGFYAANKKYTFGLRWPTPIFRYLYNLAAAKAAAAEPEELYIYNGGSFFNTKEIPATTADYIFKQVGRNPSLRMIMVESRTEYLNKRNIGRALDLLQSKRLMIGIGLESADTYVRNVLINKGLSLPAFQRTVKLIRSLGALTKAYVFLKPYGLSEAEAVEDTWQTIKYCSSLGIDEIEVSCAFIQKGTAMHAAYALGQYKPPLLWSVIELIRRSKAEGINIYIGGFSDEPPPIAIPQNDCPDNCSPAIYALIEDYRLTGQLDFDRLPDCSCRP